MKPQTLSPEALGSISGGTSLVPEYCHDPGSMNIPGQNGQSDYWMRTECGGAGDVVWQQGAWVAPGTPREDFAYQNPMGDNGGGGYNGGGSNSSSSRGDGGYSGSGVGGSYDGGGGYNGGGSYQ